MAEKESNFALGFLLGAVAGAAIGFLYAPKAGTETRALLKEKAGEVKEKAEEGIDKAREAAANASRRVKGTVSHGDE